jgi:hypothetical protein
MPPLEDPGVAPVLRHFGIKPGVLLGQGGEAQTYSLDEERVLRVHHDRTPRETVDARASLLTELARSADVVPFAIPRVLETLEIDTRIVTIERRLTGRPLTELLAEATGNAREALVRAHLDAAFRLGDLAIGQRGYGDLCQSKPIRTGRFRTYLERRATRSL